MANNTVAFYIIYVILHYLCYSIIAIINTKATNYVFGGKGLFVYVTRDEPQLTRCFSF